MKQNKTRPEWVSDREGWHEAEKDTLRVGIREREMTSTRIRHAQSGRQTERDDMKQNKTRPEWASDRER